MKPVSIARLDFGQARTHTGLAYDQEGHLRWVVSGIDGWRLPALPVGRKHAVAVGNPPIVHRWNFRHLAGLSARTLIFPRFNSPEHHFGGGGGSSKS